MKDNFFSGCLILAVVIVGTINIYIGREQYLAFESLREKVQQNNRLLQVTTAGQFYGSDERACEDVPAPLPPTPPVSFKEKPNKNTGDNEVYLMFESGWDRIVNVGDKNITYYKCPECGWPWVQYGDKECSSWTTKCHAKFAWNKSLRNDDSIPKALTSVCPKCGKYFRFETKDNAGQFMCEECKKSLKQKKNMLE